MASIIYQIVLAFQLLYGPGNYTQQATITYTDHGYHCDNGIVIIDTDEL
ncbi:MAG: hypothetical protein H0W62_03185 [Chitinophagales bacterium]|nr:hypothetical protein [Chitinophagales bacterium]